ncbi:MAG: hypothetical protein ACK41T_03925 [Pseudobdellovibrio sp.]
MAKKTSAVSKTKVAKKSAVKPAVKAKEKAKPLSKENKAKGDKAASKVKSKSPEKNKTQKTPVVKEKKQSSKLEKSAQSKNVAKVTAKEKPTLMSKKGKKNDHDAELLAVSKPKDQGDLLIEKAKEEMAGINNNAKLAEKASKAKPVKIERGNLADEKAKWVELNKRHGKDKALNYKMTDTFESLTPIQHKVLGWGFILSNENDRLEVLFENGIKMLISNYKPS